MLTTRSIGPRFASALFAGAVVLALALTGALSAPAQDLTLPDPAADLEKTLEKTVDVELKQGSTLSAVEVAEIVRDPKTKVIRSLKVQPKTGAKRTVPLSTIKTVVLDGETIYDSAVIEAKKKIKLTKEEKAKLIAEQEAERHKQYLARLDARGVKPWPDLTDAQHKETSDEHKKLMEELGKAYPGMQFAETKNFMVYTNIPVPQMMPYVASLDDMHTMMCKMYGLKPDTKVFRGKALIIAFLDEVQFIDCEARFFNNDGVGAQGICHQRGDKVVVTCYRGDSVKYFGHVLVHETSHGFIHRYKTPVRMPSWVNEGMAEYIGNAIVPSDATKNKEAAAITRMKQTFSLGGDFYALDKNIDAWQYGAAVGMTTFLVKTNAQAYAHFIEDMKEGMPWAESLKKNFNATPEELAAGYGLSVGVPGLRP